MSIFTEGVLDCSSSPLRYAESGTGPAVVVLRADGDTRKDELGMALAIDYRVLVVDVSGTRGTALPEFATSLATALAKRGVTSFAVVGVSQAVTFALAQAIYTAGAVTSLTLLSPPLTSIRDVELNHKLARIKIPTLVLVGTRDRSGVREAGRLCRAQIPVCHFLLVYEAGPSIMSDRREACLSPIREFLAHGEGFIVTHESQLIRP